MIKIKQINESDLDMSNNGIVYTSDGKLKNNKNLSSEADANSVPVRDSNGNIKVSETPSNDTDAASKKYVDAAVSDIQFPGFVNTNSIIFGQNSSSDEENPNKYYAMLNLSGVTTGSILKKGTENNIVPSSYIHEIQDIVYENPETREHIIPEQSEKRVVVSTLMNRLGSSVSDIKRSVFSVETNKETSGPDISLISASSDITRGPKIQSFAYYNNGGTRGSVIDNQVIFDFTASGAVNGSEFSDALSVKVLSDSTFSQEISSHFEVSQNGENVLSSFGGNNIRVYGSLVVGGEQDQSTPGCICFNASTGRFMGYNNNAWVPLDANDGNSSLSFDITSAYTVGGINEGDVIEAGTTVESLAKNMFDPSKFNSFTIDFGNTAYASDGGYLEIGQPVTVSYAEYISNDTINSVTIEGNGFVSGSYYYDNPAYADNTSTKTFNVASGQTIWTISGQVNDTGKEISKTFTINGGYKIFFGTDMVKLTADNISDFQDIADSYEMRYVIGDNFKSSGISFETDYENKSTYKYTYFAYPSEWLDLNGIFMHGVPIFDSFTKVGDTTYVNEYGISRSYSVYVSNSPGAFRTSTKITFK